MPQHYDPLLARVLAGMLGAIITLIGVFTFIQPIAPGHLIFGLFQVDDVHAGFHLATGALGIIGALIPPQRFAPRYLLAMGLLYGTLTIAGFISGGDFFNVTFFNMNDDLLHAVVAVAALAMCFLIVLLQPEAFFEPSQNLWHN